MYILTAPSPPSDFAQPTSTHTSQPSQMRPTSTPKLPIATQPPTEPPSAATTHEQPPSDPPTEPPLVEQPPPDLPAESPLITSRPTEPMPTTQPTKGPEVDSNRDDEDDESMSSAEVGIIILGIIMAVVLLVLLVMFIMIIIMWKTFKR